jgi:hypothetical protein
MPEDHRTKRKDSRADPNDHGGFLLGNEWCWFHDRPTAPQTIGSQQTKQTEAAG